jgi:hypothetical protein
MCLNDLLGKGSQLKCMASFCIRNKTKDTTNKDTQVNSPVPLLGYTIL